MNYQNYVGKKIVNSTHITTCTKVVELENGSILVYYVFDDSPDEYWTQVTDITELKGIKNIYQ